MGAHQARLVSFPCFDREIGLAEPRPPADTTDLGGSSTLEQFLLQSLVWKQRELGKERMAELKGGWSPTSGRTLPPTSCGAGSLTVPGWHQ